KQWQSWVEHIQARVKTIPGVTATITVPETAVQPCPRLRIEWDGKRPAISASEVERLMFEGEPRIVISANRGAPAGDTRASIGLLPIMMSPGEEKVVADKLYSILSNPPKPAPRPAAAQ